MLHAPDRLIYSKQVKPQRRGWYRIYTPGGRKPEDSVNPVWTKQSGATDLYHGSRL